MKAVFGTLSKLLRFHKTKFLVLLLFVLLFLVVLFPFDDLSDFMTTKVSEASGGSVYVQADGLGLHWLPTPGVRLTSVLLQIVGLPNIASDELTLSPSFLALLRGALGADVFAKGLFKGNVDLTFEAAEKNKQGQRNQKIKLDASDIALSSLSSFIRDMSIGDFKLGGALNIVGQAKIDPSFEDQPTGNVELSLKNFIFPSYVIYMGGAPMFNLPELKFKKSYIKTALADGKMQIDDITLGDDKDDLSCKLHGDIAIKLVKGKPSPDLGAYNFNVEIKVLQKFYDQNSVLFALLKPSFKKPMAGGQKFTFKISGDSFMSPPRMSDF